MNKKKSVTKRTVIRYLEIQLLKSMILLTCDFPNGFTLPNRPRLLNCNSQQTSQLSTAFMIDFYNVKPQSCMPSNTSFHFTYTYQSSSSKRLTNLSTRSRLLVWKKLTPSTWFYITNHGKWKYFHLNDHILGFHQIYSITSSATGKCCSVGFPLMAILTIHKTYQSSPHWLNIALV